MSFIWKEWVWESWENISSMPRRDVLKWWLWFWALTWLILSWNIQEAKAQTDWLFDPEIDKAWNKKLIDAFKNNDKELLQASLDELPESDKQVYLDAALTWVFFKSIIPRFLSWKVPEAMSITMASVSLWYALSSEVARHHFTSECMEAWVSVLYMMAIVSAVEWASINIEQIIQEKVAEKFSKEINDFASIENKTWKMLEKLWMAIIWDESSLDEPRSVYEEDWIIFISKEVFLEILPFLVSSSKKEEIFSRISKYTIKQDFEKIKSIISSNIETNWFWELEETLEEKEKNLSLLWNIFMYEISSLINFVLVNQLIFWLWQTTLIKEKVLELWTRLEIFALSNWFSSDDAKEYSKKFVNLSISYIPNRFAFASDLWPVMAALAKWWWSWVLQMINWVLPVVYTNIFPYINQVGDLLKSSLWSWTSFKSNFHSNFWKDFLANWEIFWKILLQAFQTVLNYPLEILSAFKRNYDEPKLEFQELFWDNNEIKDNIEKKLKVKNKNKPFILSSKKLNYILKRKSNYIIPENDFDLILSEIEYFLSNTQDLTADYQNSDFWIENIKDLIFVLDSIYFEWNTDVKHRIEVIFRNNIHKVRALADSLKGIHSEEDKIEAYKYSLQRAISKFIDIWNYSYHNENKKSDPFEEIVNSLKLKHKPIWDFGISLDDLELSLEWNITKTWSYKALANVYALNVRFLKYLKSQDEDLYKKHLKIFVKNISDTQNNLQKWDSLKLFNSVSTSVIFANQYLNDEEKSFYENEILSQEEMYVFAEDYNKFKSSLNDNYETWELWIWDKLSITSFLRKRFSNFWVWLDKVSSLIEKILIHIPEHHILWKNSFEILQMILLIQTPYVLAVKDTIARTIKQLPATTPASVKEYFIALWTYTISMFADNYVWLVVWIELAKELLWMDEKTAIEKFSKYAIYWWSKVVTWNSPNALFDSEFRDDFYFNSNFTFENKEYKEMNFLTQINSSLKNILNAGNKTEFLTAKEKLLESILNWKYINRKDYILVSWELEKLNFRTSKDILETKLSEINKRLFKSYLNKISWWEWVISSLTETLLLRSSEVIIDVLSLQIIPSVSWLGDIISKWDLVWWINAWIWAWVQLKSAWGVVSRLKEISSGILDRVRWLI